MGDLQKFLEKYSAKYGNQITPAGQALVDAGLFTTQQLQEHLRRDAFSEPLARLRRSGNARGDRLQLPTVVPGAVGNDAFFTFDLRLGWS